MPAKNQRQRSSKSGTTARSKGKKPPAAQEKNGRKQAASIVLFAFAVFLLFLVLIPGSSVWLTLHNVIFGLFGVCSFVWPVLLGYIAVMCALDRPLLKVRNKVIQAAAFIVLTCAVINVLIGVPAELGYIEYVGQSYTNGAAFSGGGFFGGALGYPFFLLAGKLSAIIIILILFVLFMFITSTSLLDLWRVLTRPAVRRREHRQMEEENRARFNVDVPLGDMPEHPVQSSGKYPAGDETDLEARQKKLIEAYTADLPAGQVQPDIDTIVDKKIKKEKKEEKPSKTQEKKELKKEPDSLGFSVAPGDPQAYRYPPVSLLSPPAGGMTANMGDELKANAGRLVDILRSFGVETRIIDISRGPSITRYELQPSAGVKISKITNLADDIAMNLAATAVRIEAPIPGKSAVGIEVPNNNISIVHMSEILDSPAFTTAKSKLTTALGKDISGEIVVADLAKMPHLLIAGSTGSGKSVCINSLIISLLYKATPDEVKLLMIDPKMVELAGYNGIPHLLVPVVTDPRKAAGALGWAVSEMLKRYNIFSANHVRDLSSYNQLAKKTEGLEVMPQIVIIIDELADLMMAAPNEVEDSICRLAQMARAAGMYLVIATQRPSVDVITGIIKANIPSRIAFTVSSQVDSRTILDAGGAEKLIGRGDMLYAPVGASKPLRVQGCFVSDQEIEAVVNFVKNSEETPNEYDQGIMEEIEKQAAAEKKGKQSAVGDQEDGDERINEAIEVVVEAGVASTSLLQRRMRLGYARASRMIDQLEERGIVGPFDGAKPRTVLITRQQWMEMKARSEDSIE